MLLCVSCTASAGPRSCAAERWACARACVLVQRAWEATRAARTGSFSSGISFLPHLAAPSAACEVVRPFLTVSTSSSVLGLATPVGSVEPDSPYPGSNSRA